MITDKNGVELKRRDRVLICLPGHPLHGKVADVSDTFPGSECSNIQLGIGLSMQPWQSINCVRVEQ